MAGCFCLGHGDRKDLIARALHQIKARFRRGLARHPAQVQPDLMGKIAKPTRLILQNTAIGCQQAAIKEILIFKGAQGVLCPTDDKALKLGLESYKMQTGFCQPCSD